MVEKVKGLFKKQKVMKKITTKEERVNKFLVKLTRKNGWNFSDLPDARQEKKVKHEIVSVIWALELGLMANMPTLRDIEDMTSELGSWARRLVSAKISDTTLDTEVRRLDQESLLAKLVLQIRDMNRSKILKPHGLPCGVATIDGKNLATLDHYADGHAHRRTKDNKKWQKKGVTDTGEPYWLTPVLRSTLTSSLVKPCIYQKSLPPGTGESTNFKSMIDALEQAYGKGKMVEIYDGDAAFASLANADYLKNRLSPEQILLLVRQHWGIENDCFNSLDVQWQEDSGKLCTQGQAVWGLGILRIMAYNVVQYFRKRRLRRKDDKGGWLLPMRWRLVFKTISKVVEGDYLTEFMSKQAVI